MWQFLLQVWQTKLECGMKVWDFSLSLCFLGYLLISNSLTFTHPSCEFQVSLADVLETLCKVAYRNVCCGHLTRHHSFNVHDPVIKGKRCFLKESICSSTALLVTLSLHVMLRIYCRQQGWKFSKRFFLPGVCCPGFAAVKKSIKNASLKYF